MNIMSDDEMIVYEPCKFRRKDYKKLMNFIEENVVGKEFNREKVYDITYYVTIWYKDGYINIVNNIDLHDTDLLNSFLK